MSVQAISWAMDHRVHSVTEKVILLVLANYANEYGISWPSQRTLAENAACDERTVRRTLVSLEARGVIRRIARRRGNGSRQSELSPVEPAFEETGLLNRRGDQIAVFHVSLLVCDPGRGAAVRRARRKARESFRRGGGKVVSRLVV
jgi:DNA-binding transcriptional MocR family regulator